MNSTFTVIFNGFNADFSSASTIPILQCKVCGLAQSDQQAIQNSSAELYPEGYYGEKAAKKNGLLIKLFQLERRYYALRSIHKPGRLLDVGCGDGVFLENLNSSWQKFGFEPSEAGQKQLAQKAIQTFDVSKDVDVNQKFDVITLWQSFEHVAEPSVLLQQLRRLIKDDGTIFISVPNFASLQAKIFGAYWFHLDPTRHLYHYEPKQLKTILENNGYQVMHMGTHSYEYGVFGWWQSFFNLLPFEFNKGYKLLKARKRFKFSLRNTFEFIMYAILAVPIALISLLMTWVEFLTNRGGVIQLRLRLNKEDHLRVTSSATSTYKAHGVNLDHRQQ